jgi:hypothetical protein
MVNDRAQVLQILPKVPPAVCGVGDYAWALARCLQDDLGIHSRFLCGGTTWQEPAGQTEFPVHRLPGLTASQLLNFLNPRMHEFSSVILHMSSYGFQKRGVPLWLTSAWEKLALMPERPRLLTMFHELAASGPATSSAFWLRPLQQWVMRRIARASDGLRTNREGYAAWLRSVPGMEGRDVLVMPVFSNFGEPSILPAWQEREAAMSMFGWGIFSGESLAATISRAAAHCRRLGLSRLHVLGGGVLPEVETPGVEVRGHGFMAAADISRLMLSCRVGYSAYNPEYFGKSTLMAAFASHGLAVICQGRRAKLEDGLQDGVHLLNETTLERTADVSKLPWAAMADALKGWYDRHSLALNAASYADQLRSLNAECGAAGRGTSSVT